jgi:hypothetical protein
MKVGAKVTKKVSKLKTKEIFVGFGIISSKGMVLEVYRNDFSYAVSRRDHLNTFLPGPRKWTLVKVMAVAEKLSSKEIEQIAKAAKDGKDGLP